MEEVENGGILWIFDLHVQVHACFLGLLCVLSDLSVLLCTLQEKGDVGLKEEQTQYVYAEPPPEQLRYFLCHTHPFILCSSGLEPKPSIPGSSVAIPYPFLGHQ